MVCLPEGSVCGVAYVVCLPVGSVCGVFTRG